MDIFQKVPGQTDRSINKRTFPMQAGLQEEVPPPPSGPQVQSVQHVLQTIQGVLSIDPNIRHQAEALLKAWEADAVPGFLISLLQIVEQSGAIDEVSTVHTAQCNHDTSHLQSRWLLFHYENDSMCTCICYILF